MHGAWWPVRGIAALFILAFLSAPALAQDALQVGDNGSSAGYVTLVWPDAEGASFTLEEQSGEGWTTLYEGSARATTLSGLSNGTYVFRLSSDGAGAPSVLTFEVAHHPLSRALMFFGLGAVLFLILLFILFTARPQTAQE